MSNIFILFMAWLLDIFFSNIFGISFVGFGSSINSNILFIALILVTYKQDKFKSILYAIFVGAFMDIFSYDYLYTHLLIYSFIALIVSAWSMRINDSFIEILFLTLAAIFLKEVLLYGFYYFIVGYNIELLTYLDKHLLNTIIVNLIFSIILVSLKVKVLQQDDQLDISMKRVRKYSSQYRY